MARGAHRRLRGESPSRLGDGVWACDRVLGRPSRVPVAWQVATRLGFTDDRLERLGNLLAARPRGPIRRGYEILFDGTRADVDGGDETVAAETLERAVAQLDEAAHPEDAMWVRVGRAALLGTAHPVSRHVADWVRAWIVDRRTWGFAPLLDGLIELPELEAARDAG